MIISAPTSAAQSISGSLSGGATRTDPSTSGFGPEYQVDLSPQAREEGLAVNNAATGITESKMRNVLTRILLETLFGVDAPGGQNKEESSEEEMVREVVLDPAMEQQLRQMSGQIVA